MAKQENLKDAPRRRGEERRSQKVFHVRDDKVVRTKSTYDRTLSPNPPDGIEPSSNVRLELPDCGVLGALFVSEGEFGSIMM